MVAEDASAAAAAGKIPVTIEVTEVARAVRASLSSRSLVYRSGPIEATDDFWRQQHGQEAAFLAAHVAEVRLCDAELHSAVPLGSRLMSWQVELAVHAFQMSEEEPADAECDGEEGAAPAYREWQLPTRALASLWDALIYEQLEWKGVAPDPQGVKRQLLQYAAVALHFSRCGVDANLVAFNRTVLLHGPPGTGKTSLCRALAQKLAIRFSHRFERSQLIEVDAHSLFSKWFSESGKLVTALFARIREVTEDEGSLVFVLIDEVESLTAARQAAVGGSEPGDAVRAVNALLTALDSLRALPNVMLLTTSNITEAIDAAFLDRVDIRAYLGPPQLHARYEILRSSVAEMQRTGIISPACSPPPAFPELRPAPPGMQPEAIESLAGPGEQLRAVAAACEGMSGRRLRKLPFLAHILLCSESGDVTNGVKLGRYLAALHATALREQSNSQELA